ncbi:hypothetical protein F5880DRAFT_1503942 [Lentinula raphanica]|nr:hypothetical protein F5880DRAFT_1503942 [Lentinula raphanica]
MSASVTNSALTTLYQVVTYLTQPLIKVYPSQAVLQLQFNLHANLASQFLSADTSSLSPFTLLLAPSSLPPAPVYAACLQAGLVWSEWIRALGGRAFYVFVMDGHLKVRIGETGDAVTIWSAETTNSSNSSTIAKLETQRSSSTTNDRDSESPMTLKLQAMLDSVRCRALTKKPSATSTNDSADDSDSDSDSESDTDSTTSSSLFSETSSIDSMSSVSSTTSSPILKTSSLPPKTTVSTDRAVYVPRHRFTTTPPVPTEVADSVSRPLLSRSQRRLARATVDKTKVDTCRYTYQGGQTLVMTGGVMLGGVKAAGNVTKPMNARNNVTVARSTQAGPSKVKPQMMMTKNGPDASKNWRVRA